jgi:hypothetical protein
MLSEKICQRVANLYVGSLQDEKDDGDSLSVNGCSLFQTRISSNSTVVVDVDDSLSLSTLFCDANGVYNSVGSTLVEKCKLLQMFDSCEAQRFNMNVFEVIFILITMCVYTYVVHRHARLEGAFGAFVLKRRFMNHTVKQRARILREWRAKLDDPLLSDEDVLRRGFDALETTVDEQASLHGVEQRGPSVRSKTLEFYPRLPRIYDDVTLAIVGYLVLLIINMVVLGVSVVMSDCPEDDKFTQSLLMFFFTTLFVVLSTIGYNMFALRFCPNNAAKEQRQLMILEGLIDEDIQSAILTGMHMYVRREGLDFFSFCIYIGKSQANVNHPAIKKLVEKRASSRAVVRQDPIELLSSRLSSTLDALDQLRQQQQQQQQNDQQNNPYQQQQQPIDLNACENFNDCESFSS